MHMNTSASPPPSSLFAGLNEPRRLPGFEAGFSSCKKGNMMWVVCMMKMMITVVRHSHRQTHEVHRSCTLLLSSFVFTRVFINIIIISENVQLFLRHLYRSVHRAAQLGSATTTSRLTLTLLPITYSKANKYKAAVTPNWLNSSMYNEHEKVNCTTDRYSVFVIESTLHISVSQRSIRS